MGSLFLKILQMSVSASWLVLVVVLFRWLLKAAPKTVHCLLWVMVALRLLCPVSPESSFSLVPDTGELIVEVFYPGPVLPEGDYHFDSQSFYYEADENGTIGRPGQDAAGQRDVDSLTVAGDLWLLGMAVMASYAAFSYLRLRARVAASLAVTEVVYRCDYISSPFILGLIKPKIYLPSDLRAEALASVLAHERSHLKRRDHWWKPLGFVLLTVHWFNPVMWIAYILLCRDIELACDERVIREMDSREKKAYTSALLECSVSRHMITVCPLAFGEVGVKERVKAVLSYRKPGFWIVLTAVIASIAVAVCFLTDPIGLNIAQLAGMSDLDDQSISITVCEETIPLDSMQSFRVTQFLKRARLNETPISQNRIEHSSDYGIMLGNTAIYFDSYFSYVWVNDGVKPSFPYLLKDQEAAKDFFGSIIGQTITPPKPTEPSREEDRQPEDMTTLSHACDYANMRLTIPGDWEYEIHEFREEDSSFGISFRPEGKTGHIRVEFRKEDFAVCGTGLRTENWQNSFLKGTAGYYDGSELWSFIHLSGLPGTYVILNEGADAWWDDFGEEAMQILNNLWLAEGILTEQEAIARIPQDAGYVYDHVYSHFDYETGIWRLSLANGHSAALILVEIDPEGNVIGQEGAPRRNQKQPVQGEEIRTIIELDDEGNVIFS